MNEQVFLGGCPIINDEGIFVEGRRVIRFGGAVSGVGVGALERRNPMPPGKYWVDVFTPQEAAFQAWLKKNKPAVAVVTTETFPPIDDYPGRTWRLFTVQAPVTWEGPGFATIAEAGVETSEDTGQRPEPEKDPLDKLSDFYTGGAAKTAFWVIGAVVAVVVGGVIIARFAVPQRPAAPTPAPAPYA